MKTQKAVSWISGLIFLVSFLPASDLQITTIEQLDELPPGFRSIGKIGDVLVTNGAVMALIGGSKRKVKDIQYFYPRTDALGTILGIQPVHVEDQRTFIAGSPLIKTSERYVYLEYDSFDLEFSPDKNHGLFTCNARLLKEKDVIAEIETTYRFSKGSHHVRISSIIKNISQAPIKGIDYSLYFQPNHSYSFQPFNSDQDNVPELRVFPKDTHALAWKGRKPSRNEEELVPGNIAPGESYSVEYDLFTHNSLNLLMNKVFCSYGLEYLQASIQLEGMKEDTAEVIIKESVSDSIYFRSFIQEDSLDVSLPPGVYTIKAHYFPAVVEKTVEIKNNQENVFLFENPAAGLVHVKVSDSDGSFIPAKVSFIGLDPSPSPYFKPENPMQSGKEWEGFKNSCFPPEQGLDLHLPVGSYLVTASRGPEYSISYQVIEVLENSIHLLEFELRHILDTSFQVSLDPHLHTFWSDGDMDIPERLRSIAAEGIDTAVSTDHNILIDYAPELKNLGLDRYLRVVVGNEITQDDLIHCNTFPLVIRPGKLNRGAVNPASGSASTLFQESRENHPECLIMVNHPRSTYQGYFHTHSLDLESAAFASRAFDLTFDLIEVMNGPRYAQSNAATVQDWFHFLDRGYFFPAVGSSDSHSIDRSEPGYSRTYVIFREPQAERPPLSSLFANLKKGHSFITNGPLIDIRIDENAIPGDLLTPASSSIRIALDIKAAPWIAVDEVRLIINGKRQIAFPVKTKKTSSLRFSEVIEIPLEKDIYIAAEVIGKNSLFPVLQRTAAAGDTDLAALPYALTNPIFIDADGSGSFDPPVSEKIRLLEDPPLQKKIKRY